MAEHDNIGQPQGGEQPQSQGYSQQGGYDPNAYAQQSGYSQQGGYDPNAYAQQSYGYGQQGGYNPNAYSQQGYGYSQQGGYDPNAYSQQSYGYSQQSGYDPNSYAQQSYGYGQQSGYDPNSYAQQSYGYGQQSGYDPNSYAQQGYGYTGQSYVQQTQDPNNPLRVTLNPNNPSTSSNNITLNLDSLYEKMSNEMNRLNEVIDLNKEMKEYFTYLMHNNAYINIFSYLGENESAIGSGNINTINNTTISVNSKIIALKFISYIQFSGEYINEVSINQYFYNNSIQKNNNPNNRINNRNYPPNDFFNFLSSKKSFNQFVSVVISSSFLTVIDKLTIINLNEDIAIFKSNDELYYMIPLDKIVSIE